MIKQFVLGLLLASNCATVAYGRTRAEVAADARANEIISSWTPSTNTHVFSPDVIFISKYYAVNQTYDKWPYVYGGREAAATTTQRINNGTCPGGVSNTDYTTQDIYDWWTDDPTHRPQPAQHLAGIDCNGFAMRMLGITSPSMLANTNAWGFRDYCVSVAAANLDLGDVLISPTHIRMVTSTSPFEVSEAVGNDIGRVITRETEVGSYLPYSPFPIFAGLRPIADSITDNPLPEIKLTIKSGTNIIGSSILLRIDGSSQTLLTYPDGKDIQVAFTPSVDLSSGQHSVNIYAKNSLDLEDSTTWYFRVGEFRPYLSSVRAVQGGSAVYASQWTASGAGMKLGSSYPKEASSESGIAVHLGFSKSMSPLEEVSLDGVAASTVYTVDPSSRDWRAIFSSTAVSGFGKSAPLRLTVRGKDLAGNSLLRTAEDRSLPDMSALSSAITANGGADEVHRLHPPYYLTATPLIQPIPIFIPWIRHSNSRRTAPRRVGKATPHQIFRLE